MPRCPGRDVLLGTRKELGMSGKRKDPGSIAHRDECPESVGGGVGMLTLAESKMAARLPSSLLGLSCQSAHRPPRLLSV